jgi:hypothetical protein
MVETPAAVQLIKELCETGIKFISFGTNDLTQYILAIDRGNEEVQNLYNEMHPAVLYQLEFVIRVCKRNDVETSICGQAGSKKEMVKFLVEKGIDSISVNADMAKEISDYIAEIEKQIGEEPRQYQKKETEEFVKPQVVIPEEEIIEEEFPVIKGAQEYEDKQEDRGTVNLEEEEPEENYDNSEKSVDDIGTEIQKQIEEDKEEINNYENNKEEENEDEILDIF